MTWRRKVEPIRDNPQGLSGTISMSRAEKGGRTDRVRGNINKLAERGCRGQERPGEQVEAKNTARSGREVEAGVSGCLSRWSGNTRPEEKGVNWVLKERYSSV